MGRRETIHNKYAPHITLPVIVSSCDHHHHHNNKTKNNNGTLWLSQAITATNNITTTIVNNITTTIVTTIITVKTVGC